MVQTVLSYTISVKIVDTLLLKSQYHGSNSKVISSFPAWQKKQLSFEGVRDEYM